MQVAEVQLFPGADHLGVFLDVQPANVCVEESSHGIVGVGIRLRIFVVDAVVAGPVVYAFLIGNGVAQHEEESDGE